MHAFKWGSSPCRLSTLHRHGLIRQPPSSERRAPLVFFSSCHVKIDVYVKRRTRRRTLGSTWWDVTAAAGCRKEKKLERTLQSGSTFPHLEFEILEIRLKNLHLEVFWAGQIVTRPINVLYGESRGAGLSCNKPRSTNKMHCYQVALLVVDKFDWSNFAKHPSNQLSSCIEEAFLKEPIEGN